MEKNKILKCPNKKCLKIPEISYSYDPFNPIVKYKCIYHKNDNTTKEILLNEFLQKASQNLECSICHSEINNDFFIYCQKCNKVMDNRCFKNCFEDKCSVIINSYDLFNKCLKHNRNFIFYCKECNKSLCSLCNLDFHNGKNHLIQQLITFKKNKNEQNNLFLAINKQRFFLNKIKKMIYELIEILEKDLEFKEKMKNDYENNNFNYQVIQNFNTLIVNSSPLFYKK